MITLDRSADKGKVETLVASDNVKGGEMAADYMVNSWEKSASSRIRRCSRCIGHT